MLRLVKKEKTDLLEIEKIHINQVKADKNIPTDQDKNYKHLPLPSIQRNPPNIVILKNANVSIQEDSLSPGVDQEAMRIVIGKSKKRKK